MECNTTVKILLYFFLYVCIINMCSGKVAAPLTFRLSRKRGGSNMILLLCQCCNTEILRIKWDELYKVAMIVFGALNLYIGFKLLSKKDKPPHPAKEKSG